MTREVQYSNSRSIEYHFPSNIAHNREVRLFVGDVISRINTFAPPTATLENKTFKIERRVSPQSVLDLRVVATQAKTLYEVQADLTVVYDDDERESKRVRIEVIETSLVDERIQDPSHVGINARAEKFTGDDEEESGKGWRIWVIISFCIFFGTIIIFAIDVSRQLIRGKQARAARKH